MQAMQLDLLGFGLVVEGTRLGVLAFGALEIFGILDWLVLLLYNALALLVVLC